MKIEQLKISGFGRIQGRDLKLSDGVTVLYGQNESGKSTTLQFIRSMLFGIPGRGNPVERYEPLQGGSHGGSLMEGCGIFAVLQAARVRGGVRS
jgi:uncharacterized protein YhaN